MPLLIAIMTFVMVVVAAAGLALANTASVVKAGVENRYSIQIADGAAKAPAAIAAARAARRASLASSKSRPRICGGRWSAGLARPAAKADLPLPAIIDVDLRPGADPRPSAERSSGPCPARASSRTAPASRRCSRRLRGLTLLAFGLVLLIALASAAAIVLAARGALDTHRATIEVMHGIGATDEQVARLFLRQIAIDALLGGIAGARPSRA